MVFELVVLMSLAREFTIDVVVNCGLRPGTLLMKDLTEMTEMTEMTDLTHLTHLCFGNEDSFENQPESFHWLS